MSTEHSAGHDAGHPPGRGSGPTRDELIRAADQYEALADACRAKAEKFGEAVVAALLAGSTNRQVDQHNARQEWLLHYDANMYQEYANSLQALADGKRPGLLPPPGPMRPSADARDADVFRGPDYNRPGYGLFDPAAVVMRNSARDET